MAASDSNGMKKTKISPRNVADKHWPKIFWGLFIVFGLVTIFSLFSGVPHKTHDNDYEAWLNAFDQLIRAGQWFPAWVKSFWFEHGSAQFIAYPPLFFYLAEIPRLLGLSLVISVKLIVGLSLLAAFFTMYLFGRELGGKKAGLIAGLLYMTFPYHFALVYIRGAYAENLAYAIAPLVFYFIYRIWRQKSWRDVAGLGLAAAAIILTNNPATIVLALTGAIWLAAWWIQTKQLPWRQLIVSGAIALLLSAFWWWPMWLAKPLINLPYMISDKFNFSHYFYNPLYYLPSFVWKSGRYFQWGIVAWVIVILVLFYLWQYQKKKFANYQLTKLLVIKLLVVTILLTVISYPLWEWLPGLAYVQFPYRFLIGVALLVALLGALLLPAIDRRWLIVLLVTLLLQSIWFSRPVLGYRSPVYRQDLAYTVYGDIKSQIDDPKADRDDKGNRIILLHTSEAGYLPAGINWGVIEGEYYQQISTTLNGLPFAQAAQYTLPADQKIQTLGQISEVIDTPRLINFTHNYPESTRIYYRQFGFPGWQVRIDGKEVKWAATKGTLDFIVPAGIHQVSISYINPPGAITGRIVSFLSLLALIWSGWWLKRRDRLVARSIQGRKPRRSTTTI